MWGIGRLSPYLLIVLTRVTGVDQLSRGVTQNGITSQKGGFEL